MTWCPKCKYEYREGFSHCSDCGSKLVDELEPQKDVIKKFNKKSAFLIALIIILALYYYLSQISFNSDTNAAIKVVKRYFNYTNKGNINAVMNLLSGPFADKKSVEYDINNTRFVKLLYIKEAPELISGYMSNGLGAIENPYEVRSFKIIFLKIYKNGKLSPVKSGIRNIYIYVTKKSKNAQWRITDMGEG